LTDKTLRIVRNPRSQSRDLGHPANSEKISETHFVSRFLHAIRKSGLLGELDCYIQHPVYSG
jgi:hypothetical protein